MKGGAVLSAIDQQSLTVKYLKELTSDRRFNYHFKKVFNGIRAEKIPLEIFREIVDDPKLKNTMIYTGSDGIYYFLDHDTVRLDSFIELHEESINQELITGVIIIKCDALEAIMTRMWQ